MQFEYGLSGKWPELLEEIAPRVTRVAVLRNKTNAAGDRARAGIQVTASSIGMEMTPVSVPSSGGMTPALSPIEASGWDGKVLYLSSGRRTSRSDGTPGLVNTT